MSVDVLETPAFVIDKRGLDANVGGLADALERLWPNYSIGYSVKTNSLAWMLGHLKELGCKAEVVSGDEYDLARLAGYGPADIIYNGPVKGRHQFDECVRAGGIVNLDAQRELAWVENLAMQGESIEVGLRVNFDIDALMPEDIGCAPYGTRFGFSMEKGGLDEAFARLAKLDNVRVAGLHMHSTSKTRSVEVYRILSRKAVEVARTHQLDLGYIDIGGGFFGGLPWKPSFVDYVGAISEELGEYFSPNETALIVEPGSALVASPISFVVEVVDVKDVARSRVVTLDGSRINIDPLHIKSSYFYHLELGGVERPAHPCQVVAGFTCMETDRVMVLEDEPELTVGDRIVFEKVGSYTMTLNPLFISYFPSVYVADGEHFEKVREHWTAQDIYGIGSEV